MVYLSALECPVCFIDTVFDGRPCFRCAQRRAAAVANHGRCHCAATDRRAVARRRATLTAERGSDGPWSVPLEVEQSSGHRRWLRCDLCLGTIRQSS